MKVQLIVLFALIALIFTGLAFSQEDVEKVADKAFGHRMRPPVPFFHDAHNETAGIDDCESCHHMYDEDGELMEDETSEDQPCSDCHVKNDCDVPVSLADTYHTLCKSCHMENKKGPIQCGECHLK